MNCRSIKKLIPLLAGRDLPERKVNQIEKHLQKCPDCRAEFKELKAALEEIKTIAREEEAAGWTEPEWKALIKNVITEGVAEGPSIPRASTGFRWAYGLAVLALLAFLGFLLFIAILKPREIATGPEKAIVKKAETPETAHALERPREPVRAERHAQKPIVTARSQKSKPPAVQLAKKVNEPEIMETQGILSVTLVSKETGLKVTWIFDKNFDWEGEEK